MRTKSHEREQIAFRLRLLAAGLNREYCELALDHFARLNGWEAANDFGLYGLAASVRASDFIQGWRALRPETFDAIFDHDIAFTVHGLPVAVLSQPYDHSDYAREIFDIELNLGLACRQPPKPRASFWYPGRTLFLLFVCPGESVRWLPEQLS